MILKNNKCFLRRYEICPEKKNTISTTKKYQPNEIAFLELYILVVKGKNYLESFFLIEIGTHTASAEMKTTQLSQKAWLVISGLLALQKRFSPGNLLSEKM